MRLYTSYYGNLRKIPSDFFVVSVSDGLTDELKIVVDSWDQDLAPSKSIRFDYKEDRNWDKYVSRFKEEILPTIDFLTKLEQWEEKANKIKDKSVNNIVLLCYESADPGNGKGQFCHRYILAEHFENEFSTKVLEYGYEDYDRINYKLEKPFSANFLF